MSVDPGQQDETVTGADDNSGFGDIDFSTIGVQQPEITGQAEQQNESGDNPKWAPFLKDVPEFLHPKIKEHLKAWDQGVNQRFQQIQQEWAPYKPLRDQQLDPEQLIRSRELAENLARNPVEFYNRLRTGLLQRGLITDEQNAQMKQQIQQIAQPGTEDPNADDPYIQKITALEQQIEQQNQALVKAFQTQQQQEIAEQAYQQESQQIETDFNALEQRIGRPLPMPVKAQIVEKAMILGQTQQRHVTIEEAASEVFKVLAAAQQARRTPPRGIPGAGGSIPQSLNKDPREYTADERMAAAQAIRERLVGNS